MDVGAAVGLVHDTYLLFDIVGTIAFGLSGVVVAIKSRMDLGGVIFMAFITGCGGGTIRDLILQTPVFWTENPQTVLLAVIPGILFFVLFYNRYIRSRFFNKILATFDTVGLAAFTLGGASKALFLQQNWLVVIMMGAVTAVGGGVLRDLCAQRVPSIFRAMFYLTPVVAGSIFYIVALTYVDAVSAAIGCLVTVIGLRYCGERFHWRLPKRVMGRAPE